MSDFNDKQPTTAHMDPQEIHGEEEKSNILKLTMEVMPDVSDEILRERLAEKKITGSRHLPAGATVGKAIITGGESGIGRGTAFALAEDGYNLVISYLDDPTDATEVQRHIREEIGRECYILQLDISQVDAIQPFVLEAHRLLGGIDLLLNNAGIAVDEREFESRAEDMDYAYEVNYRGPILLLQEVAKRMRDDGTKGSIINISSIHATHAEETDATYGALKAAMSRSTLSYALQFAAFGIRVNSILPGAILIDKDNPDDHQIGGMKKIPLMRSGLPRDIAHAVSFLASERASYITGVNLHVDGGMALLASL